MVLITSAHSEIYPYLHSKQESKMQAFKVMQISTRIVPKRELVMTGQEKASVEISCGGVIIQRRAIVTTYIEVDNIIVK